MDHYELITVFLQAQEPDYFQNIISAVGKSFSNVIKMGEMVENGLKTGKIISQAVLKAPTQVDQIESYNFGNFGDPNEKVEEIMMTSGSRRGPKRTSQRMMLDHQDTLEGEHEHNKVSTSLYKIFKFLMIHIQARGTEGNKGRRIILHQQESHMQDYFRS